MPIDNSDPTAPIIIPSIKNGPLIKECVAPTNFIIVTSSLRAIIVNRIVFMIINRVARVNNPTKTNPAIRAKVENKITRLARTS